MTVAQTTGVFREFCAWMDTALVKAPPTVAAFCFFLYEHETAYCVQVAASSQFDPVDHEWASRATSLFMPEDYLFWLSKHSDDDEDWRRALAAAIDLIRRYMEAGARANVLRESQGVACGFVDGDLHLLWPVI